MLQSSTWKILDAQDQSVCHCRHCGTMNVLGYFGARTARGKGAMLLFIVKKQCRNTRAQIAALWRILTLLVAGLMAWSSPALSGPADYPAASLTPRSQPGWDAAPDQLDATAPADEAQAGMTEAGTPISKRTEQCFPAEQRDLFSEVDKVADPDGTPVAFSYPVE